MQCPKCQINCDADANFCSRCGARLPAGTHPRGIWRGVIGWIGLGAGLAVLLWWGFQQLGLFHPAGPPPETPSADLAAPKSTSDAAPRRPVRPPEGGRAAEAFQPVFGRVILRDITGEVLLQTPVFIVAGGWVALPAAAVAGAYDWTLQLDRETEFPIEGGVLFDSDEVGLWRINSALSIGGSRLAPWRPDEPLAWRPLAADGGGTVVLSAGDCARQGHFWKCGLAGTAKRAGILLQQNQIVGWAFGEDGGSVYLWHGLDSERLQPEFQVADHYRLTFAGSREESFLKALALENSGQPGAALAEWADGFTRQPVLSPLQRPEKIRPDRVIGRIYNLMADMLQTGAAAEVADLFGPRILQEAGSLDLILAAAEATLEAYGYPPAVQLMMAAAEGGLPDGDGDGAKLADWHRRIYNRHLTKALDQGRLEEAWDAYYLAAEFLPEDPGIHLSAARLALAAGDWRQAETLLKMRSYPAPFGQQAARLADQVAGLKAMAGKIAIRFTPGARNIPVTADIGGGLRQRFIVDTGATLVTVPTAAAEALGIAVDSGTPRRRIVTAGGVRFAPEIILPQVAIDGWVVGDVRALVLDLPERPGWGLLGLNYLRRFDLDLQSEKGLLLLAPR